MIRSLAEAGFTAVYRWGSGGLAGGTSPQMNHAWQLSPKARYLMQAGSLGHAYQRRQQWMFWRNWKLSKLCLQHPLASCGDFVPGKPPFPGILNLLCSPLLLWTQSYSVPAPFFWYESTAHYWAIWQWLRYYPPQIIGFRNREGQGGWKPCLPCNSPFSGHSLSQLSEARGWGSSHKLRLSLSIL